MKSKGFARGVNREDQIRAVEIYDGSNVRQNICISKADRQEFAAESAAI
jgi:predicted hydrolase (HD superfamily)